jgi:hypothetical protein
MHSVSLFGLFELFGLFYLLLAGQLSFSVKPRIPRTLQTPPFCYECKFFKPLSYGKYDTFGKCSLYVKVYDDILQHEYADIARQNKKKCGENGTDFQAKTKTK